MPFLSLIDSKPPRDDTADVRVRIAPSRIAKNPSRIEFQIKGAFAERHKFEAKKTAFKVQVGYGAEEGLVLLEPAGAGSLLRKAATASEHRAGKWRGVVSAYLPFALQQIDIQDCQEVEVYGGRLRVRLPDNVTAALAAGLADELDVQNAEPSAAPVVAQSDKSPQPAPASSVKVTPAPPPSGIESAVIAKPSPPSHKAKSTGPSASDGDLSPHGRNIMRVLRDEAGRKGNEFKLRLTALAGLAKVPIGSMHFEVSKLERSGLVTKVTSGGVAVWTLCEPVQQ